MAQFANMFEVDLNNRSYPVSLVQTVSEGNVYSNRIGAYVYKDGAPVNLGGACTGLVMRADGMTVPMTGVIDGNAAYVVLNQESCAIPGPIQVAVSWVSGSNTTTLLVAYGTVITTDTRSYVQSGPIADVNTLLGYIGEVEQAAADAAESAASAAEQAEIAQNKCVRFDTAQSLTNTQKATARGNIDAADTSSVNSVIGGMSDMRLSPLRDGYGFVQSSDGTLVVAGSTYGYSRLYEVVPGDVYEYAGVGSSSVLVLAAYANADDVSAIISESIVGEGGNQRTTGVYTVPEGVHYLRLTSSAYNDWAILRRYIPSDIPLRAGYGFVQSSDGALTVAGSTYWYSGLYEVKPGDTYEYAGYGSESVLVLAAYSNRNDAYADVSNSIRGVSDSGLVKGIYTVPDSIHYIRITSSVYYDVAVFKKSTANDNSKKSISILFVGNSLTQDGIAYLPYLLRSYYPDIEFNFYMWYNGGKTLGEQYSYFANDVPCDIFSVAENTRSWTNYNGTRTMSSILSTYKFDIVCMQEYFNFKENASIVDWNNCRDYITANYTGGNGLEFISLFHAPKRDNADVVFNRTVTGNNTILQQTIADDMIPTGIAVYRAMSTSLDSLGDQGHLSPDGTHTQEGLPCLLQTYVAACWLFDRLGIPRSVYGCPLRITSAVYSSINVPGPNLGTGIITGTDAQNILAQEVAIQAYKEGKYYVTNNIFVPSNLA